MFKKKNISKTIDFNKDIEAIEVDSKLLAGKGSKNKESGKNSLSKQQKGEEDKKLNRYGLIEKEIKEVKLQEKPKQQNFFVNMYIKRRLEQIQVKQKRQNNDTTASEILQMQKQYLSIAESKITQYDYKEVQKKLQKMATDTIKTELDQRRHYLVDLLQNQYEKMEYASKKQLKGIKQERERLQKELSSKYKSQGRRHYIEYMKTNHIVGNF